MIKLYKRVKRVLHYHEAWIHKTKVIEHWGKAGERGETAEHKREKKLSEEENIEKVLAKAIEAGYTPVDEDDLKTLNIEYKIDGFGTPEDLAKRHALEDRMSELLGWTGLGHCDGGGSGSDTMDVCCLVVDFKLAKKVIAANLKGTEFADYAKIEDQTVEAGDDGEEPTIVNLADGSDGVLSTDLLNETKFMDPPWKMGIGKTMKDPAWKTEAGKSALEDWKKWFFTLTEIAMLVYFVRNPEPKGWKDFYAAVGDERKK